MTAAEERMMKIEEQNNADKQAALADNKGSTTLKNEI